MRGDAAENPNAINKSPLNFLKNGRLKFGVKVHKNTNRQHVHINPTKKVL